MKISGNYTIDAPRQVVWEALNDLDVLARIVPGCQRLEQTAENEFEGTLKIGIAAVKGIYTGKIQLQDIQELTHYTLVAKGRSSNAVIDGTGSVDLADADDGKTLLTYSGDAEIGGTLASVGQRLIEGASRQLLNQSLKALDEQIKLRMAPAPAEAATPAVSAEHNGQVAVAAEVAATKTVSSTAEAAVAVQPPEPLHQAVSPSPERRTVVVPADEQLQPSDVFGGIVSDFVRQRPWLPWVVVALLLGYLLGRSRSDN